MREEGELKQILKEHFGFDHFRPMQLEIITSTLEGKDNLVIMPTGGGKSICFQLPALVLPGVTVVISPLIALMKDQVDGLRANGIAAAYLNSSQTELQRQQLFTELAQGTIKLLYVAPESLQFIDHLFSSGTISLIAIDEAHCISSWGHDFRPAYTQLGYLKKRHPSTPIMALTATADKATRTDILHQLKIPDAKQHITSFNRKNLFLEVRPGVGRLEQIKDFLKKRPRESGIIYCLSRKDTEELAQKLREVGMNARAYHAGFSSEERAEVQEAFIRDDLEIICATIAFGMGIDKSNVRWVIHYNMPKNLEGYYQEIGRAGRDGLPSDTLLFHSYGDVFQLQRFTKGASNEDIQLAKLERMKQYAEALTCRRRILLSYFGEIVEQDCGNCDVCKNPPQIFDGTVLAQKALSCVWRLRQQEPMPMVIDVLRNSQRQELVQKGYHQLSTYGVGQDTSWQNWQQYLIQLINQGFLEVAFHQHNHLKLTPASKKVLFEKQLVKLAKVSDLKPTPQSKKGTQAKATGGLFDRLRTVRTSLSRKENIAPYLIFSDATLKEMEQRRPMTDQEFMEISGVGRKKMQEYGYDFIKEIIKFHKEKREKKEVSASRTAEITYEMYKEGKEVEEIARLRKLKEVTIFSHLCKKFEEGADINLSKYVPAADIKAIRKAQIDLGNPDRLSLYFEHFQQAIPYQNIRIALLLLQREESLKEQL